MTEVQDYIKHIRNDQAFWTAKVLRRQYKLLAALTSTPDVYVMAVYRGQDHNGNRQRIERRLVNAPDFMRMLRKLRGRYKVPGANVEFLQEILHVDAHTQNSRTVRA